MRIRLQPHTRPQAKRPPSKLKIALLSLTANHLHFSNELARQLDNLSVAAIPAASIKEYASVENRCCQLRNTVQSTALAVLGCALRQRQDWFDDNDTALSNLLVEKNRLHKAHVNRPTDDNKPAFYRSRSLVQQWLQYMQDVLSVFLANVGQNASQVFGLEHGVWMKRPGAGSAAPSPPPVFLTLP
ncbi:hypothetical protein SprV_0401582100 [Sparganum proliferum]